MIGKQLYDKSLHVRILEWTAHVITPSTFLPQMFCEEIAAARIKATKLISQAYI